MRILTMNQAILEAQMEEMERDSNVFLIGEDVAKLGSAFQQSAGLYQNSDIIVYLICLLQNQGMLTLVSVQPWQVRGQLLKCSLQILQLWLLMQ